MFVALISVNLARTTFSVQKRSTLAEVEASPLLTDALGTPLSFSTGQKAGTERFSTRDDRDVINLRDHASGPKGEAELSAMVQNASGQGWAGDYRVQTLSKPTLVDGKYVSSESKVLAVGSYAADGTAQPLHAP